MPLILLRHGSAGDSETWEHDDSKRPLDEKGERQARQIVERLAGFPISAIHTSPHLRCVQTVALLAEARELEPLLRPELAEGAAGGHALVRELAGEDVVVCGHGGLERVLVDPPKWRKGAAFVVGLDLRVEDEV